SPRAAAGRQLAAARDPRARAESRPARNPARPEPGRRGAARRRDGGGGARRRRPAARAARFPGRVEARPADLNFVDLPAAHYDLVVSSSTIHHVTNLEYLASQIDRTLPPD